MARILGNDSVNLGLLFFKIMRKWYWFAISIPLFTILGYFYAQSLDKVYGFKSVLLLSPKRTGSDRPDVIFGIADGIDRKVNTDDEIGIITSYDMISRALDELDFGISLYKGKDVKKQEIYPNKILDIRLDSSKLQLVGVPIYLKILSKQEVEFWSEVGDEEIVSLYNLKTKESTPIKPKSTKFKSKLKIGTQLQKDFINLKILPNTNFESNIGKTFHFIINNPIGLVKNLKLKLLAEPSKRNSFLIELTTSGVNSPKEINFLNKLMEVTIKQDLIEKNRQGHKAINFIEEQLKEAREDLVSSEQEKESFQSSKKLLDVNTQTSNEINDLSRLIELKTNTKLKLDSYESVYQYLLNNPNQAIISSNFNIDDNVIVDLFKRLANLNQTKSALEISETVNSPNVLKINRQINETRLTLKEYLEKNIEAIKISLASLNYRINTNQDNQTQLPFDNRTLDEINRKFLRNTQRYEALLTKRDEARIGLETNTPDVRVIEEAKKEKDAPIKPNNSFIYMMSMMLGLGLPFAVILIGDILNSRIMDKDDVLEATSIPLLAMIADKKRKKGKNSTQPQDILFLETIRSLKLKIIHTLANNADHPHKNVIGITSTIPNEGKTFCAIELATSLAANNKKVLLINADLYKPDFEKQFAIHKDLKDYLQGKSSLNETINYDVLPNLDIISPKSNAQNSMNAGNEKLNFLICELKNAYDYVIVDIPPMGIISDFFSIKEELDVCLYMTRYNFTQKKLLTDIEELSKKQTSPLFFIVLNKVKFGEVFDLSFKNKTYKYYRTK